GETAGGRRGTGGPVGFDGGYGALRVGARGEVGRQVGDRVGGGAAGFAASSAAQGAVPGGDRGGGVGGCEGRRGERAQGAEAGGEPGGGEGRGRRGGHGNGARPVGQQVGDGVVHAPRSLRRRSRAPAAGPGPRLVQAVVTASPRASPGSMRAISSTRRCRPWRRRWTMTRRAATSWAWSPARGMPCGRA